MQNNQFVLHYSNKEKNIQRTRWNYKSEDDVIIDCMNKESVTLAENILEQKWYELLAYTIYTIFKLMKLKRTLIRKILDMEKLKVTFVNFYIYMLIWKLKHSTIVEVTTEIYERTKRLMKEFLKENERKEWDFDVKEKGNQMS